MEFDARHTAASMSEKTIEKESILEPDHPFECRDFCYCLRRDPVIHCQLMYVMYVYMYYIMRNCHVQHTSRMYYTWPCVSQDVNTCNECVHNVYLVYAY